MWKLLFKRTKSVDVSERYSSLPIHILLIKEPFLILFFKAFKQQLLDCVLKKLILFSIQVINESGLTIAIITSGLSKRKNKITLVHHCHILLAL